VAHWESTLRHCDSLISIQHGLVSGRLEAFSAAE